MTSRREFLRSAAAFAAGQFSYPWKLGIITDEADFDLSHVLGDFLPKYGLKWAEIRELQISGRHEYLAREGTQAQVKEIRRQLDDAGVRLSVLDTGIYKITLPGTHPEKENLNDLNRVNGEYGRQIEELKRAAEAAHVLGTEKIRVFTFKRVADPKAVFSRVVDEMGRAIQVAGAQGVKLVVENEFDCNVATGAETAEFLKALPDRTLEHNWDPGNCIEAGETPFPDAWDQLDHTRIGHMHLKDSDGHKWLPIGAGQIDFAGQFRALKRMGYSNTLSLETHYRNAQNDPWKSSVESMDGLMRVLSEV